MVTRDQFLALLDEGSIGDEPRDQSDRRIVAEHLLILYKQAGVVEFDPHEGYRFTRELPEEEWLRLLDAAVDAAGI